MIVRGCLGIFLTLLICLLVVSAGCVSQSNDAEFVDMQNTLHGISDNIADELENTARDLVSTADAFAPANVSLTSPEADAVLDKYIVEHPWAIDILLFNSYITVVNAAPESRESVIGSDMSEYTQDREALLAGELYLAEVFETEEGTVGSTLSYPIPKDPVYLYEGLLGGSKGYLASAFLPANLINDAAARILAETPYIVRVVQSDGTLIYDRDRYQLNKNVTAELPEEVFGSLSGSLKNTILVNNTEKNKIVVWDTLSVGETEWRVVVMNA